jgi:hypothetical protein
VPHLKDISGFLCGVSVVQAGIPLIGEEELRLIFD